MIDHKVEAGYQAALIEIKRQAEGDELWMSPHYNKVDGEIDLRAIVVAVIEAVKQVKET